MRKLTLEYIAAKVCYERGYIIADVMQETRMREIVLTRQICMYFARKLTKCSLTEIGRKYGKKDHATVLYSVRTVENLMDTEKRFFDEICNIEKKIGYFGENRLYDLLDKIKSITNNGFVKRLLITGYNEPDYLDKETIQILSLQS